jgi:hypothetical protein
MPKFYNYNGQKYSTCFPIEWATNHFEKTGPIECINCLHYGCSDGVFTTYCINCQEYEYNFTRIPGNNVSSVCNYSHNDNIESDYDDEMSDISGISGISEILAYNTTNYNSSVLPLFTYIDSTYTDSTYMPYYNIDCNGQLNLSPYSNSTKLI